MTSIEELTPEQRAFVDECNNEYLGYLTKPMVKEEALTHIRNVYKTQGHNEPIVVFCRSPLEVERVSRGLKAKWEQTNEDLEAVKRMIDEWNNRKEGDPLPSWASFDPKKDSPQGTMCEWWLSWACIYKISEYLGIPFDYDSYRYLDPMLKQVFYMATFTHVAVVSSKPVTLSYDETFKLTRQDGTKAIQFEDGSGWYIYDGVVLPEKYGSVPVEHWKPEWILEETNAEIRTKLLKGIGYERYVQLIGGKVIDTLNLEVPKYRFFEDGNTELREGETLKDLGTKRLLMMHGDAMMKREIAPLFAADTGERVRLPYELLEANNDKLGRMIFLKMKNPSVPGLYHIEPVPTHVKTCMGALEWRWDEENKTDYELLWTA